MLPLFLTVLLAIWMFPHERQRGQQLAPDRQKAKKKRKGKNASKLRGGAPLGSAARSEVRRRQQQPNRHLGLCFGAEHTVETSQTSRSTKRPESGYRHLST